MHGERPKILVVDDDFAMAQTVAEGLETHGFSSTALADAERAVEAIDAGGHDALVTDLRIPGSDGLTLLARSRQGSPEVPVIVMTAFSEVATAVESIRRGAYHYLTKPFQIAELALFLRRALDEAALRREARTLRTALGSSLEGLIGDSSSMRALFDLVRRAADSSAPVLLLGETGTGKGLVARALHAESHRAAERFVVVNCAAIPEALLESELFGHVRGAFTGASADRAGLFEQADRGTLFLDEIGEMPLHLQAKLLHVLETGTLRRVGSNRECQVDVRIVAATHRDLRARVESGAFREDLLYRLDVIAIEIPPLREHIEDMPRLIEHFLALTRARNPKSELVRIAPAALDVLSAYSWPGNVRELEHLLERLAVLCRSESAALEDLPAHVVSRAAAPVALNFGDTVLPIRELQRRYASWALQRFGGAKMATCEALGIDSKTLSKWLGADSGTKGGG
ncbi:MAG TPA: sigma-54 dependent transcriptional regulator [Polyangiaceae bacterium]|nr:sigma-54 dependent transcriptional regulator [Polyangiaceae bacterium]